MESGSGHEVAGTILKPGPGVLGLKPGHKARLESTPGATRDKRLAAKVVVLP